MSKNNGHCLNTQSYFAEQLKITEQFMKMFTNEYHFSFTFATESTHEDPSLLGIHDRTIYEFLQRLHTGNYLKRTALVG
jgi:hypothetical protein